MKKKKLLKKYQLGQSTSSGFGGTSLSTPKLKTWNPSYTLGATGDIRFNSLQIKPFKSNYGIDYGSGSSALSAGEGGGGISQGAMAGINAGIAALGEWSKLPQQVREGQALIADINEAKYKRKKYNVEQAERNVEDMYNRYGYTNLYGYGYPTMKYGGSLLKYQMGGPSGMYGSSMYRNTSDDYNSQLANMDPSDVTQQYAGGMFESHMDTAISSIPGWGAIMAAAMQVSDLSRGYLGEHQEKVEGSKGLFGQDTGFQDVYYEQDPVTGSTDSQAGAAFKGAAGHFLKPHHEQAAESWGNAAAADSTGDKVKYAFEGIGDLMGITLAPKMIKSGIDSANASQAARVRAALKDDKSMVGGTAGFGGSGTTRIGGNIVGSDKAQIKEVKMGGYLDKYRGGGLYANIHAKRKRGEKMRKPGEEGAPSAQDFKDAAKTAKMGMGGGIYIDPEKRGTFKAQATKMGMGVQEAASKILNAPEGKYSPEMRKKANFAKNFAKKNGGYLKQYMSGGYMPSYGMGTKVGVAQEVPRDMANAEVEGGGGNKRGETIYNAMNGTMDVVKGPKHSKTKEAGVPVVLKEGTPAEGGDFVFSDYLEITDPNTGQKMSVADFSLKYKDDPRMLEYAAQEQSRMANSKEKKKYGGMLKKYQQGTPTLTQEEIDALNALQGAGAPPSYMERKAAEAEVAARIAAEERQTSVQASKQAAQAAQQQKAIIAANVPTAYTVRHSSQGGNVYTPAGATPAASSASSSASSASSAGSAGTASSSGSAKSSGSSGSAGSAGSTGSTGSAGSAGSAGSTGSAGSASSSGSKQAAGAGGATATQKSTTPTITSFYNKTNYPGKKTGWEKAMDSGAIDIGLGFASAVGQGLVAGFRKNPYKDMFTPSFKPITYDKQLFDRLNMKYARDAADRAFARGQETVLASGAGPNLGANLQALENNRKSAYEQIMGKEMEFNIRQDAAEKDLNARLALQTDIQNQEMQFKTESAASAAQQLSREFESERPVAIANAGIGFAKDVRETLADVRYANAILGDQVDMSDNLNIARATQEIKAANPQNAGESNYDYQLRIQRMLNDAIRAANS